jgi:hypothetical protein
VQIVEHVERARHEGREITDRRGASDDGHHAVVLRRTCRAMHALDQSVERARHMADSGFVVELPASPVPNRGYAPPIRMVP